MTPELEATFQALQATRNSAAVPVLEAALDEPDAAIQLAAANALLARRSRRGQLTVVSRLDRLDPSVQKELHAQAVRLDSGIRDALASGDPHIQQNASALLTQANDFSLANLLVRCLSDGKAYTREVAMSSLKALLTRYRQLLERGADGQAVPVDLDQARTTLTTALRVGIDSFQVHNDVGVLLEYLTLVQTPDETIRRILVSEVHPAHAPMIQLLRTTPHPQVVRWLFELMRLKDTRDTVLRIVTSRTDEPFLKLLLSQVHWLSDARVATQLKRVQRLPWLDFRAPLLRDLDGRLQASAVILASQLGLPASHKLALYAAALEEGKPEARRAAVCATGQLTGPDADGLILHCTTDPDAQVQLAATREAMARQLTGATGVAVRQLDSEDPTVRAAARSALNRYDFETYWRSFDRLDRRSRRQAGQLIQKIDTNMKAQLAQALQSGEKAERFRALKMVTLLGVDEEMTPHLVKLASDPDHMLRASAISALEGVVSPDAAQAVGAALTDTNARVRANAVETLYSLSDPRTVEVFRLMTRDPVSRVRANAALGLYKLGLPEESLKVIGQMLSSEDPLVRASAVWAAYQTGLEQAVELVRQALHADPAPNVRQLAARLLKEESHAESSAARVAPPQADASPEDPALAQGVAS